MLNIILTAVCALLLGAVMLRLKVPGGMIIGAILGAIILNVATGRAQMPYIVSFFAQSVAGAFIGSTIERSNTKNLIHIWKPALVVAVSFFVLNIVMGFLIHFTGDLYLFTALMSCVPGGLSDATLIAQDLGADTAQVLALQFVRVAFGIGFFPSMIAKFDHNHPEQSMESTSSSAEEAADGKVGNAFLMLLFAITGGFLGRISDIPAGVMVFSMVFSSIYSVIFGKPWLPKWMRRAAQALSGAYVGCYIGVADLIRLRYLLIPVLIVISGYLINCYLVSSILHKRFGLSRKSAMLILTPAGVSDMALIAADLGVNDCAEVAELQVMRVVIAVAVFPQINLFISNLFG